MKKIDNIIKKSINNFLIKENYRELYLPFDGNPNKPNFMQFIDHLEEIGYYGTLKPSGYNPLDDEEICFAAGCESFYFGYTEDGDFDDEGWDEFIDYINEKYNMDFDSSQIEPSSAPYYDEEYSTILVDEITNKGKEDIKYLIDKVYTFKNGLIYVERAIKIADLLDRKDNYFKDLEDYDDGVGIYWSYEENCSDTYYDSLHDYENTTIILKGYTDPKSVRWEMGNRLVVEGEYEIRLEPNAEIELFEITTLDRKRFPLEKPIIVTA